jgi:hypothetical protein
VQRTAETTDETVGVEGLDRTYETKSIRRPKGERAHVAVRKTTPTTIEVVEASKNPDASSAASAALHLSDVRARRRRWEAASW